MNDGSPELIKALFNQALSAASSASWETAENACKQILALQPDQLDAAYLLGLIYQNSGNNNLAITSYERVLELSGCHADALNNLGILHETTGSTDRAIYYYNKAAHCNPSHLEANYNLGRTLRRTGELLPAIKTLKTALAINRESVPTLLELGLALKNAGQTTEAVSYLQKAREIEPGNPVIHNVLGNIHQLKGELEAAISSYKSAIQLKADFAEAYNNLGSACVARGDVLSGLEYYRKAVEINHDCTGVNSNILLAENYIADSQEHLFLIHEQWGKSMIFPGRQKQFNAGRTPHRRIRLGYVSPDFRAHSVAWFLLAILKHYNRDQFHTTCFSDTVHPDQITENIKSLVDEWKNISSLPCDEAVKLIEESNIDILVDLAGHTASNRLDVFAKQAAPVQVTYLGYPNTTGLKTINYRITDNIADPPGIADRLHTESLVRLPECFICYTPCAESPECSTSPVAVNHYITFGSFNVLAKISEECVETWSTILNKVADSKLVLKSSGLNDPDTRNFISERFKKYGIDTERIKFIARTESLTSHLELYSRVDISLDPFPYNGTTTTCESLWMGVPVISLGGNRHAGRVGQSLLTQAGLEELVAKTRDEYVKIVERLAEDRIRLNMYRNSLREQMADSPICDGPGFTRSLESAFSAMLQESTPGNY